MAGEAWHSWKQESHVSVSLVFRSRSGFFTCTRNHSPEAGCSVSTLAAQACPSKHTIRRAMSQANLRGIADEPLKDVIVADGKEMC